MFLIKATLIGKFGNKEAFKQWLLKKLTKDSNTIILCFISTQKWYLQFFILSIYYP